ncbi:MAG: metallophosphoesterase family protein, partial [Acetobacteraceae bacterium]
LHTLHDVAVRPRGLLPGVDHSLHELLDRPGHAAYAPCTAEQLAGRGYAYWALGHVHAREIVGRDPWIVFPGNLQGRDMGETGAKGATLVTVRDGGIAEVQHRVLDVVRFARTEVSLSGAEDEDAAFSRAHSAIAGALRAAEHRLLAVRCVLQGATRAHGALSRNLADTREKLRNTILAAGGGDSV